MKKINNVLLCIIILTLILTTGCGSKSNSAKEAAALESSSSITTSNLESTTITDDSENGTASDDSENMTTDESRNQINSEDDSNSLSGSTLGGTQSKSDSQNNDNATEFSLVMVGDVLLHTPVSDSGLMEDGSYNYSHLFRNVRNDIEEADIALVNQEVILGGTELGLSGYPAFNGAYEVGDALVEAGFDVVLHATNHALDKGRRGILNCINYWRTSHPDMGVIGINESQEEQNNVYVREVNGIKVAILNYTYGTNGISLPSDMPYCVNLLDGGKIAKDMEIAKQISDFIIVCPHWGTEYTHNETAEQEKWAEYFTELGANLIIGTHPHVIEPVKWVEASNGNRALVYYSIGNFINATSDYGRGVANRMIGAMAKVIVAKNSDGSFYVKDYSAIPLVTQMISGRGQITTYKLSDYSEELAAQNEIISRDSVFSLQYCKELCDSVFGEVKHN